MKQPPSILDRIFREKREAVLAAREKIDLAILMRDAARSRKRTRRNFKAAIAQSAGPAIIAEIKRGSPSKGVLNTELDVEKRVRAYEAGGATAISVLTEGPNFGGSLEDLSIARKTTSLPILRKDFIFDEFQILESAMSGADAVLLIAAMLDDHRLTLLRGLAEALGMDSLVEVHDETEMKHAIAAGATLVGINNRNLHTFETSLDVSRRLAPFAENETILISESGLNDSGEITELAELGIRGFLIGEALVTTERPAEKLASILDTQF